MIRPRLQTNPFTSGSRIGHIRDRIGIGLFRLSTYVIVIAVIAILGKIASNGAPALFRSTAPFINSDFFLKNTDSLIVFQDEQGSEHVLDGKVFQQYKTDHPEEFIARKRSYPYAGGGILGPLLGTIFLVLIALIFSLPVGVSAAIYLNEYVKSRRVREWYRIAVVNLTGVPSIVYGLFGFALFCMSPFFPVFTYSPNTETSIATILLWPTGGYLSFQGWGRSIMAGGMTLAIIALPIIIAATEQSLRAVPRSLREASFALGASRWQCIRTAVLPCAMPGILSASILGMARVAGETAAIMLTAVVAMKDKLPLQRVEGQGLYWLSDFLTQSVQALSYHIYVVSGESIDHPAAEQAHYGAVLVFLLVVVGVASITYFVRRKFGPGAIGSIV